MMPHRSIGMAAVRLCADCLEQLSFTYNEAEAYASGTKAATEKPVAVKAHERKR